MAPDFQKFMVEATRLAQAGELAAATAMVQHALNARTFAAEATASDDGVIDIVAREVSPRRVGTLLLPRPQLAPLGEGHVESGSWGQGRATRAFKLFVPPREAHAGPRPLVVMLPAPRTRGAADTTPARTATRTAPMRQRRCCASSCRTALSIPADLTQAGRQCRKNRFTCTLTRYIHRRWFLRGGPFRCF